MIEVKLHCICDDCGKEKFISFSTPVNAYHTGGVPEKCDCGGNMRIYKMTEELVL